VEASPSPGASTGARGLARDGPRWFGHVRRRLTAVRHGGGGGALAMLGPGKHVREVDNDEAKAIVHSAMSAVVRNGGMAVAARSFARPWRACSAESERERGEAKGEVSDGAGSSGYSHR
jgi:hypothetical protein